MGKQTGVARMNAKATNAVKRQGAATGGGTPPTPTRRQFGESFDRSFA